MRRVDLSEGIKTGFECVSPSAEQGDPGEQHVCAEWVGSAVGFGVAQITPQFDRVQSVQLPVLERVVPVVDVSTGFPANDALPLFPSPNTTPDFPPVVRAKVLLINRLVHAPIYGRLLEIFGRKCSTHAYLFRRITCTIFLT
jgi:hypothetical protein